MSEAAALADHLLRGAAVALNVFVAVQFASIRPVRFGTAAGASFAVSVAAYVLVSSVDVTAALAGAREVLVMPAVLASAFFWWFALALFEDGLRPRAIHAVPAILLLVFYAIRRSADGTLDLAGELLHQSVVVVLFVHVVTLALSDLRNDLVDARRRFRLAVSLLLPAVGLTIAATETYRLYGDLPAFLAAAQAPVMAALSFAFALWTTRLRAELFSSPAMSPQPRADLLGAADRIELERLRKAIDGGACFTSDLTLGALARQLEVPEHRLRRLINRGLGYRNFAAFLNDHRIAEAKRRLADPESVREQVSSIAFGLGYSSLAPFNRAFRDLTGLTPTDYRARLLSERVDSGNP
jgi:AraC-like DNA-binding protein